jgi:hypothetical protein
MQFFVSETRLLCMGEAFILHDPPSHFKYRRGAKY